MTFYKGLGELGPKVRSVMEKNGGTVNRKFPSVAAVFFSAAFTLFLTDQVARYAQYRTPTFAPTTCVSSLDEIVAVTSEDLPQAGLGAMIEAEPGGARLVSVIPGHAAKQAGLRLGDRIVTVDGESAVGHSSAWMIAKLRGRIGTTTSLEVERGKGILQRSFRVDVVRQAIDSAHSVYSRVRDGELVIKVLWLDENTAGQISSHLAQACRSDVTSVVLDLESVSYGDVSSVVESASLFLSSGKRIGYLLTTDETGEQVVSPLTTTGHAVTDRLDAVRVGPYTARVGELLARALASHSHTRVVGSPSAGVGFLDAGFFISSFPPGTQLLDAQGRKIEGHPLKPNFWAWSNVLAPLPMGL